MFIIVGVGKFSRHKFVEVGFSLFQSEIVVYA